MLPAERARLDLYSENNWPIFTRSEERPPAKFGPQSQVLQSMVSNGCEVHGLVKSSIVQPRRLCQPRLGRAG